ncbi:MAG: hypothetical protein V3U24_11265 [Candidatus Neomarinimicrobiota bacterium]
MEYSHFGYFLAVCIIVFGTVIGWHIRMLFIEKRLMKRLDYLRGRRGETDSDDG